MTCMQHATTEQVEHAWSKTGSDFIIIAEANWGHLLDAILMCTPTIDGTLIPENPMVALPAGRFTQGIPMLFGTNNNEGSTFVYAALKKSLSPILYDLALDVLFGKVRGRGASCLLRRAMEPTCLLCRPRPTKSPTATSTSTYPMRVRCHYVAGLAPPCLCGDLTTLVPCAVYSQAPCCRASLPTGGSAAPLSSSLCTTPRPAPPPTCTCQPCLQAAVQSCCPVTSPLPPSYPQVRVRPHPERP